MKTITAFGTIKDGKLTIHHRSRFEQDLKDARDGVVELSIKKKNRRSSQQNAYLWGVVYKEIEVRLKELGNDVDSEVVHEFCKDKFNPQAIAGVGGEVVATFGRSTADLTKDEFSDYVERISEWAASTLSINIPAPNTDLTFQF